MYMMVAKRGKHFVTLPYSLGHADDMNIKAIKILIEDLNNFLLKQNNCDYTLQIQKIVPKKE